MNREKVKEVLGSISEVMDEAWIWIKHNKVKACILFMLTGSVINNVKDIGCAMLHVPKK